MANIDKFYDNMKHILSDFDAYAEYEKIGCVSRGIRANTLKIDINELIRLFNEGEYSQEEFSYTRGKFCSDSINVTESYGLHPYHSGGLYYCQEPSASSAVEACRAHIGTKILDMCAAPGGKSTQAAALTNGKGIIVSNEIVLNRAKILKSNMERMGVRNSLITCNTPRQLALALPNYFDTVLVDAPCSGEGMFLKEPQAKANWSEEYVKECSERQTEILECADKCLQNGGILVYSTCTFNKTENEEVIEKFLQTHDYIPINIDNIEHCLRGIGLTEAIRIFPHMHGGLGHFVCVMKKLSGQTEETYIYKSPFTKCVAKNADNMFNELANCEKWGVFEEYKEGIYIINEDTPLAKGLNIVSCGVKAFGIERGERLEPNHSLAMALRKGEINRELKLDRCGVIKYLRGETIETEKKEKGYGIATVDGYPLGLIKISEGVAKNKLPKGLRLSAYKNR